MVLLRCGLLVSHRFGPRLGARAANRPDKIVRSTVGLNYSFRERPFVAKAPLPRQGRLFFPEILSLVFCFGALSHLYRIARVVFNILVARFALVLVGVLVYQGRLFKGKSRRNLRQMIVNMALSVIWLMLVSEFLNTSNTKLYVL